MSDTDLALMIDRFMRRIHVALHAQAPEFDTARIGPGGAMVLLTLADMETAAMHDLARRTARDKSQMTRLVRSLEGKGLIARRPCCADARITLISLSEQGEAMVAVLRDVLARTIGDTLAPMSEAEKRTLADLMRRVAGPCGD